MFLFIKYYEGEFEMTIETVQNVCGDCKWFKKYWEHGECQYPKILTEYSVFREVSSRDKCYWNPVHYQSIEIIKKTGWVFTYYISTGRKSAQYTLWRHCDRPTTSEYFENRDNYIQHLGNDSERALTIAEKLIKPFKIRLERMGHVVLVHLDTNFGLNEYGCDPRNAFIIFNIRKGVWPFGKYYGDQIDKTEDDYILYWADQKVDDHIKKVGVYLLINVCYMIAKERGLIQKREEQQRKWEQEKENEKSSKHIGIVGERRRFEVIWDFIKSFETDYGTSFIFRGKDENGNVIVYFGGSALGCKENKVEFFAKVKEHSEYQEVKQTIIQRPTKIKIMESGFDNE